MCHDSSISHVHYVYFHHIFLPCPVYHDLPNPSRARSSKAPCWCPLRDARAAAVLSIAVGAPVDYGNFMGTLGDFWGIIQEELEWWICVDAPLWPYPLSSFFFQRLHPLLNPGSGMGGPVFWVIRPHDLHVWIHKSISYPRQKWQVCILGQCDSKPGGTPGLSDYSHLNCQHIFFVDAPDLHKHVKTMPRNSLVHHSFSKTACSLRFGTGDLGRRWILWKFYRWILWKVWILSFECSISASKTCFTQQYWLVASNIWIIFHFIYGMPSFPLTFIFFSGVGQPPTRIDLLFGDGLHHPIWVLLVVVHDWDHHMKWYDFTPGTLNFRLGHIEVILCKPWSSSPNRAPTN